MMSRNSLRLKIASVLLFIACAAFAQEGAKKDNIAGPYVPSPWPIVDEMIKLADIGPNDLVYDLAMTHLQIAVATGCELEARHARYCIPILVASRWKRAR